MKSLKSIKVAVLTVALSITASSMFAATQVANLDVTASVAANCTITTTPVPFGPYDPVSANATTDLDAAGTVVVACTKGASGLSIDLGNGANFSAPNRRMAGGGDFLVYGLFQNALRTTAWGAGATGQNLANSPSRTARTFTVYGRVPAGQDVTVAGYTDTVVATINY